MTLEKVKSQLADVRGHLVEHPLDFLIEETVRSSLFMEYHSWTNGSVGSLGQCRLAGTQPHTSCVRLSDKYVFGSNFGRVL